jgi:hypothetical protein
MAATESKVQVNYLQYPLHLNCDPLDKELRFRLSYFRTVLHIWSSVPPSFYVNRKAQVLGTFQHIYTSSGFTPSARSGVEVSIENLKSLNNEPISKTLSRSSDTAVWKDMATNVSQPGSIDGTQYVTTHLEAATLLYIFTLGTPSGQ